MECRFCMRSGSFLGTVLLLQVLTLFAARAQADEFTWSGDCGSSDWYATCVGEQCSGDAWWTYNNWGRMGCGSAVFPGSADSVLLLGNSASLNGSASIDALDVGPGGVLTVSNYEQELFVASGISIAGQLVVVNGGKLSVPSISIDNDGILKLQYGGSAGGGILSCDGDAVLAGSGSVLFDGMGYIQGSGTLTVDAAQTIHGNGGTISNALVNNGTVSADVYSSWLQLESQPKTNNGLMQATAGAYLDIYATIDQAGGGQIVADGSGSLVRLYNGAAVVGGTLTTSNAGEIRVSACGGTATVTDVTNAGHLQIYNGAYLAVTGATLTNDGTIGLNYGGTCGGAHLRFDDNVTLDGTGELMISEGDVDTSGGMTFTNTAGHTIRAQHGNVYAAMVNEGTVQAEVAPYALGLSDKPKTNAGTLAALNGAYLDISTTITQTGGGQVVADGSGSQVRLYDGAAIVGGVLDTSDGGQIRMDACSGTAILSDVTNEGQLQIYNGAHLAVAGATLTNDGTIGLNYGGMCGGAHLRFDADVTLGGTGELVIGEGDVDTADTVTFTNAAGHTIRAQHGNVYAAMVNEGTVQADVAPYALGLSDKPKTNAGTLAASNGAYLDISTTITQTGGGQIVADGSGSQVRLYDGAAILGGGLDTSAGGQIRMDACSGTATLSGVTNDGDFRVSNGAYVAVEGPTVTNNGTIGVQYGGGCGYGHLRFDTDVVLEGTGDLYVDGGEVSTLPGVTLTVGPGELLHGYTGQFFNVSMVNYGTVRAEAQNYWDYRLRLTAQSPGVTNTGTIEVLPACYMEINSADLFTQMAGETVVDGYLNVNGAPLDLQGGSLSGAGTINGDASNAGAGVEPGDSAGTLTINGNYTQGAGGTLHIQLAGTGTGQYDKLNVSGAATLDGTLYVEPIDGFAPEVGQQFTIMTFASRTGEFAAISGPGNYDVTYNATSVTLTIAAPQTPGDLDGDCDVDLGDLAQLLGHYGTPSGATYEDGDLDGDGDVDLSDLAALLGVYGTNC